MNSSNYTHLKSMKNGRVLTYTDVLAKRGDMIPCDASGKIATGHIGDADSKTGTINREKSKYLGNMKNGVLYPYREILAQRPDMVSINTPEQWEEMQKLGHAPPQVPNAITPTLNREPAPAAPETPVPAATKEPATLTVPLPDIDGLKAREAKTVLSAWAEEHFKQKIDRRPGLTEVVEACKALAAGNPTAAAG